jgi:hypothetical protein
VGERVLPLLLSAETGLHLDAALVVCLLPRGGARKHASFEAIFA